MGPVYYDARSRHAPGTVLLDYGCGDGGYLESQKGAGLELVGYENDAAQAGRLADELGLPVLASREELRRAYGGRVGVLTMHFVLEHLSDLDAAFDDAATLLQRGGTFYYVVPHAASLEARLFGRKWHNLDPPRHISFPDDETARRLADRHGFTIAERAAGGLRQRPRRQPGRRDRGSLPLPPLRAVPAARDRLLPSRAHRQPRATACCAADLSHAAPDLA